ncbi:DUF3617 domain-containing protein [Sphingobium bisphenolivorans]|uniref:DUF3617 domain-containing protein n=1 Tax=Sphingobium bisphenolivorans TaxID=1335760 RepID=UPI0004897937|nr:DUF3617 family protein [Sphingobium bisphenolivorans]
MRSACYVMAAAAMMAAGPPAGKAEPLRLAKGLEPGEWELRERGAEARRLCLSDLRQLLQVRHMSRNCKSFTVSDTPNRVVVTYDCGGAGSGRTDLRVETSRLVQVQSQGIADGGPFDFAAEGRWVGACR